MKILIRTDASAVIGSGHVMRCLTLAQQLISEGYDLTFVCRPQPGDLIDFIRSHNVDVISLSAVTSDRPVKDSSDYNNWLQVSVSDDAQEFIAKANEADVVITDHYAIGRDWQSAVRKALSCKIIAIDDLVREHDADLIVDQTLGRTCQEYNGEARVLAGSTYALLRPNFSVMREKAYSRATPVTPLRVLVSMGGFDKPNATLSVLKLLTKKTNLKITVLLSPLALHYESVISYCGKYSNVQQIDFVEDMASLMLDIDIAVGAPGSTSWERACLGLPCILIPLAGNQVENSIRLKTKNASIVIELDEIQSLLIGALDEMTTNWCVYSLANFSLCDGLGIYRFQLEFERFCEPLKYQYKLVEAEKEDISTIYDWQISPPTRRYALNPNIPRWEQHQEWMQEKITNIHDYFYVITSIETRKKMGALRLDRLSEGRYLVSIFVDPNNYRQGIAQAALNIGKPLVS